MNDNAFIRGKVPMTKSEVRAISISKLSLSLDSILYDIGAGTGSVSVESAMQLPFGMVYAVEQKEEAIELIHKNREKFGVDNIEVVRGHAPDALVSLKTPTHAFLGGTSGEVEEILKLLLKKNPGIRIVMNVAALESLAQAMASLKRLSIEPEVVSVQIARAEKAGTYHLMKALNPVYILSFGGMECDNN